VHGEGSQLIEGDAVEPPITQWSHLGIGGEYILAEATGQTHHGQVELTVATKRCRVDQPAGSVLADEPISAPQVAMKPSRGLEWPHQLIDPIGDRLGAPTRVVGKCSSIGTQSGE